MKILHVGLSASSEENADRFFVDVLGLEKSGSKMIDKNLMHTIFEIKNEVLAIRYRGEQIDFEIFVQQEYEELNKQVVHSCIQINDLEGLISKCKDLGVKVIQVQKSSGVVTFISDFDGNLFELKE